MRCDAMHCEDRGNFCEQEAKLSGTHTHIRASFVVVVGKFEGRVIRSLRQNRTGGIAVFFKRKGKGKERKGKEAAVS